MPTSFEHAVNTDIGTTAVDVVTSPVGFNITVIGCNLTNTTTYDTVLANVYVIDEGSNASYYVKDFALPPGNTIKIVTNGEKLILPENSTLRIESSVDDSIDSVVSYVELS